VLNRSKTRPKKRQGGNPASREATAKTPIKTTKKRHEAPPGAERQRKGGRGKELPNANGGLRVVP
jgi:hypothetical protein